MCCMYYAPDTLSNEYERVKLIGTPTVIIYSFDCSSCQVSRLLECIVVHCVLSNKQLIWEKISSKYLSPAKLSMKNLVPYKLSQTKRKKKDVFIQRKFYHYVIYTGGN